MVKEYRRRLQNIVETTNIDTGEQFQTKKEYSVKVETEEFYFTFIEAIGFMHNIKSEVDVLAILCINSEFNTGKCFLTSERRKIFADYLGITVKGFNTSLKRLCDKGAIKNNGGTIEINPLYLWKGSVAERNKILKERGLELKINFQGE